jgi:hypothetical protein
LDLTAEVSQASEQALDGLAGVVSAEVVSAQVSVFDTVAQHVIRGGEHGGRDRGDGLFRAAPGLDAQELSVQVAGPTRTAAQAAVTSAVFSQVPLLRTRVLRRLPALSSLRGHRPA